VNDFTASNGVSVRIREHDIEWAVPDSDSFGSIYRCSQGSMLDVALAEFYQARRDERLGRWRWPENPQWVVYRDEIADVLVLNEASGEEAGRFTPDTVENFPRAEGADAARAYFDAHPEPKPWHDAKPGEGWVIDIGLAKYPNLQAVVVSNEGKFLFRDGHSLALDHDYIQSGHRFHPEVSS